MSKNHHELLMHNLCKKFGNKMTEMLCSLLQTSINAVKLTASRFTQ